MKQRELVDLHSHTTASDGLLTPSELVYHAKKKGLKAIAITDHDITDGIDEGIRAGKIAGLEVIPGIELNTQIDKKEIHILGYYIEKDVPWFQEILKEIRNARHYRAIKIISNLKKLYGFDISFDEVEKQVKDGSSVARPHIARALVDKGFVTDIKEAFDKYIGTDCPAYVDRYKLTPLEGIDIIRRVGGVPVLAHPGLLGDDKLVEQILSQGVMGIEAYHSKHDADTASRYIELAKNYNLIITAGSDCHGELVNGKPIVGNVAISSKVVDELKQIAKKL